MKAGALLIAAAIATGVSGKQHARNHVHEAFHLERGLKAVTTGTSNSSTELCGCTTIYTTITGEGQRKLDATWRSFYFPPPSSTPSVAPPSSSSAVAPPASTTAAPATTPASTSAPAPATTSAAVPTPTWATVCETPGTYTIPATTVTITETCAYGTPTPTTYPPGTYTQPQTVITVTEDIYTYICPLTSSSAPVLTSSATYAPAPTSSSAPASSSSPSTSSSSSSSGLGNSGNQWAISYTPYNGETGACLDQATVSADIAKIAAAGFETVRIYSTDCSALEFVGSACQASGLKIILGVFISNTGCSAATEQVEAIASWAQWNIVELIVFGNEAIFSGYTTGAELAGYIGQWKGTLSAAGYTGPCTTTEPLNVLQENTGTLCEAVDVVGANIHAYFNADTVASDAGPFVQSQLSIVDSLCPGKTGINLECGWPSSGDCNGVACPGTSQQKTAIDSVMAAVGGKSVLFSYQNDYWKEIGSCGCEQSWGIITSVF
ncbi:hypothetical protein B7494_g5633 [Chlorociboria aeruginascens]|nr:hypothetical protein B7494_g5633 [Chlorociboria aeruginascens]